MAAPPAGGTSGSNRPDGTDRRLPRVPPPAGRRPPPPPPPLTARPPGLRPPGARPPGARPRVPAEDHAPARRPAVPRAGAGPSTAGAPRRPGRVPGRLRRFVRRYGWRAYAIPLLTVATLLTLVDIARQGTAREEAVAGPSAAAASSAPPAATAGAAVGPGTPSPTGPAEGEAPPTDTPVPSATAAAGTYVEQGAGTVTVVPGSSPVYGTGPLRRFVVEVEDGIGVDGAGFAAAVEATLADPRGWGSGGRLSFQRVGVEEAATGAFDFKVTLISPGNMETYCPGVGTGGYTSCRYGDRAVINLARWETAVPDYEGDVATYRHYVVNHEVGHALGNGHQPCPGPGELAPVMQQQTLGLQGCVKNPWPYP